MSTTPKEKEDGHGDHPKEEKKWLGPVIFLVVFISALFIFGEVLKTNTREDKTSTDSSSEKSMYVLPEKYIPVTFTDEFIEVIELPRGYDFSFEKITENYAVAYENDPQRKIIAGSTEKEDVTDFLPPGANNRKLLFKSKKKGVIGSLTIHLTYNPDLKSTSNENE